MEGGAGLSTMQPQGQPQQPPPVAEKLNHQVMQQLNLESLKTRALSLFKAISRILEVFDGYAGTNTTPKWQDILGQYSMVNLELFNIVEEVKNVSKAFVVLPKNVNAENAAILPVMLSSKLLPEMETDDNSKREQLLQGVQHLPIPMQIERLKARMDMIAAACENAEKVLADTRKAYGFGTRQGPSILPTMDKGLAAKIQENENTLRAAVNDGAATRLTPDQRQITTPLPPHLADVLIVYDAGKNAVPVASSNINTMGNLIQGSGTQFMGRPAASPSGANFENTRSPLPYSNSPQSTGMVNVPSPQQQQQLQQQQRSKLMQLPQHQQQQLLAQQQQLRQSSMQGLGQTQIPSLHDLHGQSQQKFQALHGQHQMPYSQPMPHQQFQARQLPGGHMQHTMSQGQLNPAMNRHLNQFSNGANNALFTSAQGSASSQMIPNMSSLQSQTLVPRQQQYGVSGNNPQRNHASQMLGDQMFNSSGMMQTQQTQQQQQQQQGGYGNMQQQNNQQSLQSNMLQNSQQRHQNPQ